MSAIINAASHRLERATGGVATAGGNLSLPQPPVAAPTSGTELVDEVPTEFGGLTHLFGGGSLAEAAGQFLPVNVGLEKPAGAIRGALGGLKPDFRNAAQKVQETITPPPTTAPRTFPGAVEVRGTVAKVGQWLGFKGSG